MKAQGQQGRLLLSGNLQFKFSFEFNGIVLKQISYGNARSTKKRIFLRAKKKLFTTQISKFEFLGKKRRRRKGRGRRSLVKNKYENRNNEIKHKILSKQKIRMTERNVFVCGLRAWEGTRDSKFISKIASKYLLFIDFR